MLHTGKNLRRRLGQGALLGALMIAVVSAPVRVHGEGPMGDAPVRHVADLRLWVLSTERTSYVMGLNERDELQTLYWGEKLGSDHDLSAAHSRGEHASFDSPETMTNLEYPGWGGRYYNEPALKVTLASGVRDLVLKYVSQEIRGDTLEIRLKDIQYDLFVKLTYKVFPKEDIIRKQAEIENRTPQVVTVESAQSGAWYVPAGEGYRLTYLTGRWAGETQLIREPIHPRQEGAGEPPRQHQPSVESVVRHRRAGRGGRRARARVVWRAGLERQLEAGGGRHAPRAPGARDGRLQRL